DGFFIGFDSPDEALACAVAIQRRLAEHRRANGFAPKVRIGVHASGATQVGRNFSGKGVHEAARIAALANGDEILSSRATAAEGMIGYARSAELPVPILAGWPAGVWLLAASASITLGIWPDIGALMVAVFVVPAAWYFHRFWTMDDPDVRRTQALAFYRNVEIL